MVGRSLIIVLLFAVTSWADISPRRDSLREMSYELSLVPSGGNKQITDAIVDRFVNIAIQKVCADFPAIERYDTIVSISGTRLYSINSDYYRLKFALKYTTQDDINIIYPLSYPPIEEWFIAKGGQEGAEPPVNKPPEPRYATVFGDILYFYQTPHTADTFIIAYYAMDSQLTVDGSATSIRPEYRDEIVLYTSILIAVRRGDVARTQLLSSLYNSKAVLPKDEIQ